MYHVYVYVGRWDVHGTMFSISSTVFSNMDRFFRNVQEILQTFR